MSILNKKLRREELATLDLFLSGALAPLTGYLNKADHISVIQHSRLANGHLWPMPFSLQLSPAEKLQAQLSGRIALLDDEQRTVAEVETEEFYRLPKNIAAHTGNDVGYWHISGTIQPRAKILHPAFNRIRRNTQSIQGKLKDTEWRQTIVLHSNGEINLNDIQQAYSWLKQSHQQNGGILLQVSAKNDPVLHEKMRKLRATIRCSTAKRITLNLLPETPELSLEQHILLQARIAKNFGATGFMLGSSIPQSVTRSVLKYRDELGLELIAAKRSRAVSGQRHTELLKVAA